MLILDFGDDTRSTITHATARSTVTTRTERTVATTATAKSKKPKDVCPCIYGVNFRTKFILLGMIFFPLKSSADSPFLSFFLDLLDLLFRLRMISGEILVSEGERGFDYVFGILIFLSSFRMMGCLIQ